MKGAYLISGATPVIPNVPGLDQRGTAVVCSIWLPLTDDVPAEATQANRLTITATNRSLITSHLAPDWTHFPSPQ